MKVLLLAFDHARAAEAARQTHDQLTDEDELTVVSSVPIEGEQVYIPRLLRAVYSPDASLALTARLRRTLRLYWENQVAWRALRHDAGYVALVRRADLIVTADELSVRSAWNTARLAHTPVWGRISTIGFARTNVVRKA